MVRPLTYLLGCCLLTVFTACLGVDDEEFPTIIGSGVPASEVRDVAPFSGIAVSGNIRLTIRYATEQSVEVTADDNVLEFVETSLSGDNLQLFLGRSNVFDADVRVLVRTPDLRELWASGSTNTEASDFDGLTDLHLRPSGRASIAFSRTSCADLRLFASGSSDCDLFGLTATAATLNLSGSSQADLTVPGAVTGNMSGSATARIRGGGSVDLETSDSARWARVN